MRPSTLLVAFAVFGFLWGAWQAVLPDLASPYELRSGPLGAMLTAGFAISLPAMLVALAIVRLAGLVIAAASRTPVAASARAGATP